MRRIQWSEPEERAQDAMSGRQSVSTMSHNSPVTPHTNHDSEHNSSKNVYGGVADDEMLSEYLQFPAYPMLAYQQSQQDVFQDQQFHQQPPMQMRTPQRTPVQDRLQAAHHDRLRTISTASNPRRSPFRKDLQYSVPAMQRQPQQSPSMTRVQALVSSKELMLDENDVDDSLPTQFFHDRSKHMLSGCSQPSYLQYTHPEKPNTKPSMQISQQYPHVGQSSRGENQSEFLEVPPKFPAYMISMESTAEEVLSLPSSQQSLCESRTQPQQSPRQIQRLLNTSSDADTSLYAYYGCAFGFGSPVELEKHKRRGHHQVSPDQHCTTGSESQNLAVRNSQSGSHKCERIDLSTGNLCKSIFSRPYDLSRHKDTIHNSRKTKVRCHLCTKEKTFSRNDVLTRHMRVVHPDVEWVGKQKGKLDNRL